MNRILVGRKVVKVEESSEGWGNYTKKDTDVWKCLLKAKYEDGGVCTRV